MLLTDRKTDHRSEGKKWQVALLPEQTSKHIILGVLVAFLEGRNFQYSAGPLPAQGMPSYKLIWGLNCVFS